MHRHNGVACFMHSRMLQAFGIGKIPFPHSKTCLEVFSKNPDSLSRESPQARIAASSSVNFSSARTTKRFPSRCGSAIQIVRPSQPSAETQPQLQPALLRLSAMISYSRSLDAVIRVYDDAGNVIQTHEHKGEFKEG